MNMGKRGTENCPPSHIRLSTSEASLVPRLEEKQIWSKLHRIQNSKKKEREKKKEILTLFKITTFFISVQRTSKEKSPVCHFSMWRAAGERFIVTLIKDRNTCVLQGSFPTHHQCPLCSCRPENIN